MRAVLVQGSPRRKGNTAFLISECAAALHEEGLETTVLQVTDLNVRPCASCGACEKAGICVQQDDMSARVFPALRNAHIVVIGTPVFFYNVPADLKIVIDRCQTLWARKYRLRLTDPLASGRRGLLLAQGATKGQNLFDGIKLTVGYTFDAVDASFAASLCYRRIEHPGDMARHPSVRDDIRRAVREEVRAIDYSEGERLRVKDRDILLFVSEHDAFYSQVGAAYADMVRSETYEVFHAGIKLPEAIAPETVRRLEKEGVDIRYRRPCKIEDVLTEIGKRVDGQTSAMMVICFGLKVEEKVSCLIRKCLPEIHKKVEFVQWKEYQERGDRGTLDKKRINEIREKVMRL